MGSADSRGGARPATRGVMRWSLGRHVAALLFLAVLTAAGALALLWLMLGTPRLSTAAALAPGDLYDAIKIALTVVAGTGGVVALVVAYRRQHLSEAAESREQDKARTERFGSAAEQLGSEAAAVRMAGAYAMAQLADAWPDERQTCIDVLCGYLRMPHAPEPPDGEQALAVWRLERGIRLTVLRLIAAHLRDDSPESWQGYDLDFTGAVLDEAGFRGARFTGGVILFVTSVFVGHDRDQVVFDEADFAEGSEVYFRGAEFRGGYVRFDRATFSGGWVTFDGARFAGGQVSFREAAFAAGEVRFEGAEFSAGLVDFGGATFTGAQVNFAERHLPQRYFAVPPAHFTGGTVDFSDVAAFARPPHFALRTRPPGLLLPAGTDIADLP